MKRDTCTLNHDYFNKIDTEEKAYWLGFLYADGCIYRHKNHNAVIIGINKKDTSHLEKIKISLGCNKKLYFREIDNSVSLRLNSKKMVKDLISLGCIEKKSLVLKFPTKEQVPIELMSHFLRGYFDGDGSIYFNHIWKIKFTSSIIFCKGLQKFLDNRFGFKKTKLDITKGKKWGSLRYNKQSSIIAVLNFLYENSTIYLDRKYLLYQNNIVRRVLCP